MNQNGPCKLCGKSAKLIKQSHIIPNFMYQGLFDETNRMILMPLSSSSEKSRFYQTGFFDKYILCKKCENEVLSKLEKYSSTILYGGTSRNPPVFEKRKGPDGVRSIGISNLDYTRFKLFLLSILWRAHISSNKFFNKVSVGEHESILREMIMSGNAGAEDEYKIAIVAIKDRIDNLVRIMPNPEVKKYDGGHFAAFFLSGFIYFINLQRKTDFLVFDKSILKESGEIEIPIISGELASRFLKAFGLSDDIADYFS